MGLEKIEAHRCSVHRMLAKQPAINTISDAPNAPLKLRRFVPINAHAGCYPRSLSLAAVKDLELVSGINGEECGVVDFSAGILYAVLEGTDLPDRPFLPRGQERCSLDCDSCRHEVADCRISSQICVRRCVSPGASQTALRFCHHRGAARKGC